METVTENVILVLSDKLPCVMCIEDLEFKS